jgi:hypothetical protein
LEGFLGGCKDGDVGLGVEGGNFVGRVEGAFEGGEIEGVEGVGDVGGRDEEGVDDLDNAAVKCEILLRLSACLFLLLRDLEVHAV